jgi:uncharacterized protein YjbJ (UPF0337 family)
MPIFAGSESFGADLVGGVSPPAVRELVVVAGRRELGMGLDDKIDNKAEETTGKVKEGVGKATDDERLAGEGKADQTSANLKQAGEKIKDAFKSS